MALTIALTAKNRAGETLSASLRRHPTASDGKWLDFSDTTFKAFSSISGTNWRIPLTEGTDTPAVGTFTAYIGSTPSSQFSDGMYILSFHNNTDDKPFWSTEVWFKNGQEVAVDISPSQSTGFDSARTVHQKLDDLEDDVAAASASNIILSVLAGEFEVIADIGNVGVSIPKTFSLPVKHEHAKEWDIKVKKLDQTAVDLTGSKVRFLVQDAAGDGQTIRIDYNTTDHPSKISFTDAVNGKFKLSLSQSDTNISETGGGDSNGIYYAEFLWDKSGNGEWQLFAAGDFRVEKGADILAG